MLLHDSVPAQAVATGLALPGLRFTVDAQLGGQAPCYLVGLAADAVTSGHADAVLVFRALTVGRAPASGRWLPGAGCAVPLPDRLRRIPHVRGDVGAPVPAARRVRATWTSAPSRSRSAPGRTTTPTRSSASPSRSRSTSRPRSSSSRSARPTARARSTVPCAVLVTSLERARDLRHPPARIASSAYRAGPRSGLDIGDHLSVARLHPQLHDPPAGRALRRAGVTRPTSRSPRSTTASRAPSLMGLEGLGIARARRIRRPRAGGATAPGGTLPVNTHGGLLAEGYLHGMNTWPRPPCRSRAAAGSDRHPPRRARRHVGRADGRVGARAHCRPLGTSAAASPRSFVISGEAL